MEEMKTMKLKYSYIIITIFYDAEDYLKTNKLDYYCECCEKNHRAGSKAWKDCIWRVKNNNLLIKLSREERKTVRKYYYKHILANEINELKEKKAINSRYLKIEKELEKVLNKKRFYGVLNLNDLKSNYCSKEIEIFEHTNGLINRKIGRWNLRDIYSGENSHYIIFKIVPIFAIKRRTRKKDIKNFMENNEK